MEQRSFDFLNELNYKEYREFIKNALGFLFFFSQNNIVKVTTSIKKERKELIARTYGKDAICYLISGKNDEIINPIFVSKDNWLKKTFKLIDEDVELETYFLENKLSNSDFLFLMMASKKEPFISRFEKEKLLKLKTYKDINNIDIYSFIIGAGVDLDYKMPLWNSLINRIEQIAMKGLSITKVEIEDFSKKMCNTNYYIPQISKDIDENRYFQEIDNHLYSSFDISDTNVYMKPNITDFNLFQIARILYAQRTLTEKQTCITFNYDNILELTLQHSFGTSANSQFKYDNPDVDQISILHTHGLLPYNNWNQKHSNSIVLSHDEYLLAYSNNRTYSYKKLYDQLRGRNLIIGNSISDYEEQKVFYNHHKLYLNEFSYALLESNKNPILNYYTVYSLYKIGIIPIFFDNFSDMNKYLKTIWSLE